MVSTAPVTVAVACADLMTASRFSGAEGIAIVPVRSAATLNRVAESDDAPSIWLVDLTAFESSVPRIRELVSGVQIIGFAPHVQEELLARGRELCDKVLVRGAAVKNYATVVREIAKL